MERYNEPHKLNKIADIIAIITIIIFLLILN